MIDCMYKVLRVVLFLLVAPLITSIAYASEVTIRPLLIDESLLPRDIITRTVTITSDHSVRKAVVYATVNEITVDSTGEIREFVSPVMTDRTNTITSWIEVTRGRIEVMPGETVEVPITLRVHPYAEPGEYHAFIGFTETSKRPEAEAIAMAGKAKGVVIKITIADKRQDSLRIKSFLIDRFVTGDDSRTVSIEVENTGDLPAAPSGEIIFYNSRGAEISAAPVSATEETVQPGETVLLEATIPLESTLGRYKANLALTYGSNQRAMLYDTTMFYMMPLHLLLLLLGGIILLSLMVALLFRRALQNARDEHEDEDVTVFVRDGHTAEPTEHDIDLKNKT